MEYIYLKEILIQLLLQLAQLKLHFGLSLLKTTNFLAEFISVFFLNFLARSLQADTQLLNSVLEFLNDLLRLFLLILISLLKVLFLLLPNSLWFLEVYFGLSQLIVGLLDFIPKFVHLSSLILPDFSELFFLVFQLYSNLMKIGLIPFDGLF